MIGGEVAVGDRVAGARVVATWAPADGWVAIQTDDGETMMAEADAPVPADPGPHAELDLGGLW